MKHGKKKMLIAASSVVLSGDILLAGTFAWKSISQRVVNEVAVKNAYPGGRLHDDFNGDKNKDIYVENFAGKPLLARVRLYEYMEIGPGAGIKGDTDKTKINQHRLWKASVLIIWIHGNPIYLRIIRLTIVMMKKTEFMIIINGKWAELPHLCLLSIKIRIA